VLGINRALRRARDELTRLAENCGRTQRNWSAMRSQNPPTHAPGSVQRPDPRALARRETNRGKVRSKDSRRLPARPQSAQ
jgi:hypothetical protein